MLNSQTLKHHNNVHLAAQSGIVVASDVPANFLISARLTDVVGYAREGHNLIIELKDGVRITVKNFFLYGGDHHNLVFVEDKILWLADITHIGDENDLARVRYQKIEGGADAGSAAILMAILSAATVGAGVAHSEMSDKISSPSVRGDNTGEGADGGTGSGGTDGKDVAGGKDGGDGAGGKDGGDGAGGADGGTGSGGPDGKDGARQPTVELTPAPNQPPLPKAVDKTEPNKGIIRPGDVTNEAQPEFSGTATAGSTIIIKNHGVVVAQLEVVDADGHWSWTPSAPLAGRVPIVLSLILLLIRQHLMCQKSLLLKVEAGKDQRRSTLVV